MLTVSELVKVMRLKQSLGIPMNEGSCFGVTDPSRLRPAFNSLRRHGEQKEKIFFLGKNEKTPGKGKEFWEVRGTINHRHVLRDKEGDVYDFYPVEPKSDYELFSEERLKQLAKRKDLKKAIAALEKRLQKK